MKPANRNIFVLFVLTILVCFTGCTEHNKLKTPEHKTAGKYSDYTLLPNGWKLTPAGEQIGIDELPLNLIVTKDEKYAITSNSGYAEHSLSVIDLNC